MSTGWRRSWVVSALVVLGVTALSTVWMGRFLADEAAGRVVGRVPMGEWAELDHVGLRVRLDRMEVRQPTPNDAKDLLALPSGAHVLALEATVQVPDDGVEGAICTIEAYNARREVLAVPRFTSDSQAWNCQRSLTQPEVEGDELRMVMLIPTAETSAEGMSVEVRAGASAARWVLTG